MLRLQRYVSTGVPVIGPDMAQSRRAASEELAATAEEMSGQAEQLQQVMQFFRVNDGTSYRAGGRAAAPAAKAGRGKGNGRGASVLASEFVQFEG